MTRARAAVAIAVAIVLAVATGCADEDARPTTLPTLTPTPTLSPSPAPTAALPAPTPDPVATEESREGVIAFTRYAIETVNYAFASGNTELLQEIAAPECQACAGLVDQIRSVYEEGGRFVGGALVAEHVDAASLDPDVRVSSEVYGRIEAIQEIKPDGSAGRTSPMEDITYIFDLERRGPSWVLHEMRRIEH